MLGLGLVWGQDWGYGKITVSVAIKVRVRPNIIIDLHLCTNFLRRQRTVVRLSDPCKTMNFKRTLTTDISSDVMQSKVGWGVPLTLYLVCHRQYHRVHQSMVILFIIKCTFALQT